MVGPVALAACRKRIQELVAPGIEVVSVESTTGQPPYELMATIWSTDGLDTYLAWGDTLMAATRRLVQKITRLDSGSPDPQ